MLTIFLLLFATLSHARPVGPLPSTPEPFPSFDAFNELLFFTPIPSSEDLLPRVTPDLDVTIEPTDPPIRPRPSRRPKRTPKPSQLFITTIFPSPSPLQNLESISPVPSISSSPKPRSTAPSPSQKPKKNRKPNRNSASPSQTPPWLPHLVSPMPSEDFDDEMAVQSAEVVGPSPEAIESPESSPELSPEESLGGAVGPGPLLEEPPLTTGQRTPCFPALATVQLSDGTIKRMRDLSIGDAVHVGGGRYSRVHMFTHRVYDTWNVFFRITTSSGRVLRATGGHFVYVENTLRRARDVRIGDRLPTAEGATTVVTAIHEVIERGLYNPQTTVGDIIVDGIRASVYTEAVEPKIAHAALLPMRVVYSLFGLTTQWADRGYPELVPRALRNMVAAIK